MDTDITAIEFRITKARTVKKAMVQALLTGRIRLVEPQCMT
jgi:type I restriction enzyme S subunit